MPHITLNSDEPGVRGLFLFRPETARPSTAWPLSSPKIPAFMTNGRRRSWRSGYLGALAQAQR
jgi:hypothetical protein